MEQQKNYRKGSAIMFAEEFKQLVEMKHDIETLRGYLGRLNRTQYMNAYRQIMKIAYKVDSISKHQFGTVVTRMERARNCLSVSVLNSCLTYAEFLIKVSEEYLEVLVAKEFLSPVNKGQVA